MSATTQLEVPVDGTEYASWLDVRKALDDWAIKHKFSFRVLKKEPVRAVYCCKNKGCSWRCRVWKNPDGMLVLTIVEVEHNCVGAGLGKRRTASRHVWLDEAVSKHLTVTKATSPKAIVECIRIHYSEEISYKVAQLTRLRLLGRDLGNPPVTRGPRGRPKKEPIQREDT